MIRKLAATAAAGLLGGALMLAGTAHAGHNVPDLTVGEVGECGEVTFSTVWVTDTHVVANTVLVVQVGQDQQTAPVGEGITVGPFDTETATIRYRVWGGGERDYDQPALSDLGALLDHLDEGGSPLDLDPPGVEWETLVVDGCVPVPDETDETDQTDTRDDATTSPEKESGADPSAGQGGGDDKLPVTGAALPVLIGAGLLLLGGGGAAVVLARRRSLV